MPFVSVRLTRVCWFCNLSVRTNHKKRPAMKRRIEKVVVLGAGTMGARIAAHFANAGFPVLLLDIVPPGLTSGSAAESNKIVRAGLDAAKECKPSAFLAAALADKIFIGNFDDDLQRITDAGWIIDAVAESLEIKKNR